MAAYAILRLLLIWSVTVRLESGHYLYLCHPSPCFARRFEAARFAQKGCAIRARTPHSATENIYQWHTGGKNHRQNKDGVLKNYVRLLKRSLINFWHV